MLQVLAYSFTLYALFYFNIDLGTNGIFGQSFLTIQSSSSLPHDSLIQLPDLTLDERHRLCLDELQSTKSSLDN